jgi:hypothetical protein
MIYSIPLAVIVFGIILVAPTIDEARYADPGWQREFEKADVSLDKSGELSRKFYEAQRKNLTPAAIRSDHGAAVISLGLSIAALFLMLRLRTFRDLFELETPTSRRRMFWMAIAAWWAWVPAQLLWFQYTFERGDYPWWADNIAIPIGGSVFFCLLGSPFVLGGTAVSTHGVTLPVRIGRFPKTGRGIVATALSTVPFAWFVFAGVRAFWDGAVFTMPVSVGGVYATTALWAAACEPRVAQNPA